jgi:lipoate-protein ligase A
MVIACRLLPHGSAGGPANMALDEALLDAVAQTPECAVFRTYGWSEPTLSLGYFQAVAEAEADPRWRTVPLVRRATGGGAIWHDHELTYALIVPKSHPLARGSVDLYRAVHAAITSVLQGLGAAAHRRDPSDLNIQRTRPFLCFTDSDREDIVLQGKKVVGSAQRRRSGAVLQHGSILLSGSALTPELPGLADLAVDSLSVPDLSSRIADALSGALGFSAQRSELSAAEVERALDLEQRVYRNPAWTRRR